MNISVGTQYLLQVMVAFPTLKCLYKQVSAGYVVKIGCNLEKIC